MSFDNFTFQQSLYSFQTQLSQAMAAENRVQDSPTSQYIDLQTHRSPSSVSPGYCLESYPGREVGYPSYDGNFMEKTSQHQQAMICLTAEYRNLHTNDRNQLPLKQDLPRKRFRTTFSPLQLKRLESEFCCSMYVVGLKRLRLAQELKLEERHIKIWFQNRRMKFKRDQRVNERNGMAAFQNYCYY